MTVLDDRARDLERELTDLRGRLAAREADLAEAVAQQTAAAEILQVINSSPGDLAQVFDAMLEKATSLCGAAFGLLFTWDGEWFHPVAWRGISRELLAVLREPSRPQPGTLAERLARGENIVSTADLREAVSTADLLEAEAYRNGIARVRALVEFGGARSHIGIALRKDDVLLGHLSIYRQEVRPFTDKQIALLQNFAAQAVIAMENARLLGELRERTHDLEESLEYQTATSDVLQVISRSTFDVQPVLNTLVNTAARLCNADLGHLTLRDGQVYRVVASFAFSDEWDAFIRQQSWTPGRASVVGRSLLEACAVHIADITADPEYAVPEAVTIGNIRTLIGVPLLRENEPIGVFAFGRTRVEPFTTRQIALLTTFADQAVIALENARLITETREALEQQTATAEVLGVINSSPGDLAPVFEAMLDKALRLCSAAFGVMWIRDGDVIRAGAIRGATPDFAEFLMQERVPAGATRRLVARAVQARSIIHIPDLRETEQYQQDIPLAVVSADKAGIRTILMAPMSKEGEGLGLFTIYRQEVRPFSEKEIALVENFAAQAVIAMENARLITETREALEQQTATAEVLGVINSSPGDLAPVFNTILEKAHTLCGADHGALVGYDGEMFRAIATRGVSRTFDEYLRRGFPLLPGAFPDQLMRGEPVHIVDLPAAAAQSPPELARLQRQAAELAGTRTLLMVPLCKDSMIRGYIAAYRTEVRPFTEKQIALLENFAEQAVIAMENARLLGELRQRTEEVAELNRGLEARVAEQVEELGRVGRLKRFLAPQLAELIVSQGDEKILESHRREIVVVFCDLRGYTAFTETAEPEEVLDFLREYHGALGPLVSQFEGTLDQFSGDGIMVFFNDPVPVPDPAERAVKMAIAMRETASRLIASWRRRDRELGFGVGIAQGYATLGQIGFADRSGYTAIGTVCNLAARLCAEAKDGQILVTGRVASAVEEATALEDIGPLVLKGLTQPVSVFNVKRLIAG